VNRTGQHRPTRDVIAPLSAELCVVIPCVKSVSGPFLLEVGADKNELSPREVCQAAKPIASQRRRPRLLPSSSSIVRAACPAQRCLCDALFTLLRRFSVAAGGPC
jgi:hypothetical protein